MTTLDLRELRRAVRLRRKSEQCLVLSDEILAREIPRLVNAGMPLTEISRQVGLSRPKLYKLMGRPPERH